MQIRIRLPKDSNLEEDMDEYGIDMVDYTRWGAYRIRINKGDVKKHEEFLLKLLKMAHENY